MAPHYVDHPSGGAPVKSEWIRLPPPVGRCQYTGLSRTTISGLIIPCEAYDYNPPVRSVVLKKRGAVRGIRLIYYDSLMDYLRGLSEGNDGDHL